jgi:DNA-directed RNA polymerase subunit RPC12/RpoP
MLELACPCGAKFSLAETIPGEEIQCPRCGQSLLVPEESAAPARPGPIFELEENPSPIRVPSEHAIALDEPTVPPPAADGPPLDLAPLAPMPKRNWAPSPRKGISKLSKPPLPAMRIFGELFQPENMAVIAFVIVFHVAFFVSLLVLAAGVVMFLPIVIVLIGLTLAHYSNVIYATGPHAKHSLPTPLGDFDFKDDCVDPMVQAIVALTVCFGPSIVVALAFDNHAHRWLIKMAVLLAGTFVFPMAWMAMASTGLLNNLRPDRVCGAIVVTGWRYVAAVLAFVVSAAVYLWGTGLMVLAILRMTQAQVWENDSERAPGMFSELQIWADEKWNRLLLLPNHGMISNLAAASAICLLGLYLLHFVCWDLGLIFRRYNERFPWTAHKVEEPTAAVPARQHQVPLPIEPLTDAVATGKTQFPPVH